MAPDVGGATDEPVGMLDDELELGGGGVSEPPGFALGSTDTGGETNDDDELDDEELDDDELDDDDDELEDEELDDDDDELDDEELEELDEDELDDDDDELDDDDESSVACAPGASTGGIGASRLRLRSSDDPPHAAAVRRSPARRTDKRLYDMTETLFR